MLGEIRGRKAGLTCTELLLFLFCFPARYFWSLHAYRLLNLPEMPWLQAAGWRTRS